MTKSLSKEKYIGSITKISSVGQDAKGRKLVHFNFVNCHTELSRDLCARLTRSTTWLTRAARQLAQYWLLRKA